MREYERWIIFSAFMLFAVYIFYVLRSIKAKPDPWEDEISKEEVDKLDREICLKCGAEVKPGQYYCSKCNHATGKYVPYLPFVNIRFNYSMHSTLWSHLKSKDHNIFYKLIVIFFILCTAPIMIIGYLFILPGKLFGFFKHSDENDKKQQ
jgi:ribosomal protein L40E